MLSRYTLQIVSSCNVSLAKLLLSRYGGQLWPSLKYLVRQNRRFLTSPAQTMCADGVSFSKILHNYIFELSLTRIRKPSSPYLQESFGVMVSLRLVQSAQQDGSDLRVACFNRKQRI